MRLLFVSHSLPPAGRPLENIGGMQRVAEKLHEALRAKRGTLDDLEYDALLLRSTWRTLHAKVPFFLVQTAWRLRRAATRDSVDLVLFSSMVTASLAVPLHGLFERHGVRTAAIVHGLDVTTPFRPYQWFVPKVFDALDAVLPVSRATREACLDRGAQPQAVHVVPNGIDVERFRRPQSRRAERETLDLEMEPPAPPPPPDGLLLCSVGRQVERKGTVWFVENVMPRLPSDVYYWIAGDGPERDRIRESIDRHNLGDRVQYLGRISNENLGHLYRASDLFVMPNIPVEDDLEGFGIVLLEAGLCGTPAIAAELDGIQDVITEGVNGRLVEPENPAAFAGRIEEYRENRKALDRLAQTARRHTEDTFGWSAVSDKYLSVLQSVAEGARRAPGEAVSVDS